jgi:hypothetical protein
MLLRSARHGTLRRAAMRALGVMVMLAGGVAMAQPTRTAMVETRENKTLAGMGGMSWGLGALIPQCNAVRQARGLPPRYPPQSVIEKLDVVDHVYAYDGRRKLAVNRSTDHLIRLDDYERWMRSQMQGAAPDCAMVTEFTRRSATLWRDGKRYSLDYEKKTATEMAPRPGDTVAQNLPARPVAGRPDEVVAGQSCSVQSVPALGPGGTAFAVPEQCLWKGFDVIGYMNLPLILKRVNLIGGPQGFKGEETATSAVADGELPEDLFVIPGDFTVRARR